MIDCLLVRSMRDFSTIFIAQLNILYTFTLILGYIPTPPEVAFLLTKVGVIVRYANEV